MNYGEIKQNIISLGFAEESDYEEYEDLGYTYDAINRAIAQIQGIFPYMSKYEFELDDTDTGILYIDMSTLSGFLSLADTPVLFEQDGEEMFKRFGDYQVETDHTIVINADEYVGSFRIYYNKASSQITVETDDAFVPELPLKAHHLIPLLASYYLWLDDDERKAVQYYNMYEAELASVMRESQKPRCRIVIDRSDRAWQ